MDTFLDKLACVTPNFLLFVLILYPICRSICFIFTIFTLNKLFIYRYLQAKSIKILNITQFVNIVNFMNDFSDPKSQEESQFSEKGLYVNDDDQDWGSAGMNDVQEDSE